MSEPLIRVRDMRYRRGGAASSDGFVLHIEALDLAPGGMVGIVGPSGCGKSTLVDLFALLRRPDSVGQFTLMGRNAAAMWAQGAIDACTALRARYIGIVLQTGGLLPSLSALENVMLSQRLLDRIDRGWTHTLFRALDLVGLENRLPAQLSIGQRQRVAIARAIAHRPALVLADEPTASLGIDHAPAALDLLVALTRDSGAAMLIVSHDVDLLEGRGVPLRRCAMHGDAVQL